jgi:hypothetical protein
MGAVANMVVLSATDNVGIATRDIPAGAEAADIRGCVVRVRETIPLGHKVALADLTPEAPVIRFGVPVGVVTAPIARGALVHVHNVASRYLNNDHDHYE